MKNKKILKNPWAISIIILIVVIIGTFIVYNVPKGDATTTDNFAQCLTEKGVEMYGTEWCPHCKNQKGLFGDSFQYINYIDCDKNNNACLGAGIEGFPTWRINNQNYPGEQSFERLSGLTGCEI